MIYLLRRATALIIILLCFTTCTGLAPYTHTLPYDLTKPEVIELSDEVHDISGIAYYAPRRSVFAIDDDHGNVYEIPLHQNPAIQKWHFDEPEDFEDIVLEGNMLYVLSSKGRIAYMPLQFPITQTAFSGLATGGKNNGKNNFETLFKDPAQNRLLMVCKQCSNDSKHKTSVFAFDLNKKEFLPEAVAKIQLKDVNALLPGQEIKNLEPSAASIQPQTGEIYMLASVNKLLLIMNAQFQLKAVYQLNPKVLKQPEGIAFAPDGTLYISNEGRKGKANILIFKKK